MLRGLLLSGMALVGAPFAQAQTRLIDAADGAHFLYEPAEVTGVLVLAQGTRPDDVSVEDYARRYVDRWEGFADAHHLALIAPVFDDARFGNKGGGFGGYRNLFGRDIAADDWVIDLVRDYEAGRDLPAAPFYLYGHSAGAQFAVRFAVQHPDAISFVVASAPGRYAFPATDAPWPYGAGAMALTVAWPDGTEVPVSRTGDLESFARASAKIAVVIGGEDLSPQPERPAHSGTTRLDFAKAWNIAMTQNAAVFDLPGPPDLVIVPGVGHDAPALTAAAQAALAPRISPLPR